MSYKTSQTTGFPPIYKGSTEGRKKIVQDYTAISVGDPREEDLPPTPERSYRAPDGNNSKLETIAVRQDQLLDHQRKVASRQDELAQQLANQSTAMNQALLQQAQANKESMMSYLARQQSDWDDQTRDLLTQHIKYMVAIIQRLNTDVEGLEAEIRGRDIAVIGTNRAVNKIEVHHVTMLQDLRSRIVRCDTAIAKHTKDIMYLMEELRRLEDQLHGSREKTMSDIHRLEAEVIAMTSELERQNGEQRGELNHLKSEMKHRLGMLEDQQRKHMLEYQEMMDNNKAHMDHMLEKMDHKFQSMIDKATSGWSSLMEQVDAKIDQNMMSILSRIKRAEDGMGRDRASLKELQKSIENQVMATIHETIDYNNAELVKAKMEFRNGFTELQESLSNMKRVVEGKRKILANQLKKEIGQVKKAMYIELPNQQAANTIVYKNVDRSTEW